MDETRHIRLAAEWATQFRVIFDYSLAQALVDIIGPDTVVATCHPNRTPTEFQFPTDDQGRTFPVRPVNEQQQYEQIDQLIALAVTAGASIVVLPELCVTKSMAARLQHWTHRTDGPRLLVAGSYHHDDSDHKEPAGRGSARRRNTAVAFLRGWALPLTQDKHSPADRPVQEDIQPQGWPELRVYVSADGWHLAIAICRDLLNPHAVHALAEAGVNLALVPAMSQTLVAFGGPVAQLVGAAQAFVAVANNPADFSSPAARAPHQVVRALFGHPGFTQQSRLVQSVGTAPGVAVLTVRTGQLRWLTSETGAAPTLAAAPSALPGWAHAFAGLGDSELLPAAGPLTPAAGPGDPRPTAHPDQPGHSKPGCPTPPTATGRPPLPACLGGTRRRRRPGRRTYPGRRGAASQNRLQEMSSAQAQDTTGTAPARYPPGRPRYSVRGTLALPPAGGHRPAERPVRERAPQVHRKYREHFRAI